MVTPKLTKRDGRFIEIVGHYNPGHHTPAEKMFLKTDRVQYWLSKGAQPSEVVRKYLGILGILPPVDYSNRTKKKPKGEVAAQPVEESAPAKATPAAPAPVGSAPVETVPEQKPEQPKPAEVTENA